VRVLPDVAGIAALGKTFDYLVPEAMDRDVQVGSLVRIGLHGRRVGGWVVADRVEPPAGMRLQPLARWSSIGPLPEIVDLAWWASWRWAGRASALLRAASPAGMVRALPPPVRGGSPAGGTVDELSASALRAGRAVLRLPPAADPWPVVEAATRAGPALVVVPSVEQATTLAERLRVDGHPAVTTPAGWARAMSGGVTVVGARAAVWASMPEVHAVVVLDAHDESLVDERAPAWNAWVVAAERARRAAVPCVLVTPCPTLEQLAWGRVVRPPRPDERDGWAPVHVVDRRADDPRSGLFSERVVELVRRARTDHRVVCVLNRKGRARLLACGTCNTIASCERCGAAVELDDLGLHCPRCDTRRPAVCAACGATKLRLLRLGVTRAREELEALARQPVGEVAADHRDRPQGPVVIGTEAILHEPSGRGVSTVVFLDFDSELYAPRFRANEQALVLLARAARLAGGRGRGGMVVVQTRVPDHPVIQAAVHADPDRLTAVERETREQLSLPPFAAVAVVSGEAAVAFAETLSRQPGLDVVGGPAGGWLVRARDHQQLCDALAATPRPEGRLRIEVDPVRV
jgi:primosomal protein N' (replication factor Y) (superfamily II helicase)